MENINEIVYFHNPLEEDFTFYWDKAPYVVGGKQTVPYPRFLAHHGGKHLIDHIILHPEFWEKLGLKRTDNAEEFNAKGIQTKQLSNLNFGREEIASLINVTKPAKQKLAEFKAKDSLDEKN